jgi:hypothetical protein
MSALQRLQRDRLAFKNPNNKTLVIKQLDALIDEWRAREKEVEAIQDHPYHRLTRSLVYADGEQNSLLSG